ncbi:hypothetical protein [Streptomyces sp. NPDC127038]|uniref:hypothetical protein n=1 Tax=Streptomyces sp. NPDC127038 TaxID=3347114 RepID=UPI0036593A32
MANPEPAHDRQGRFARTPDHARRDAAAADLRAKGRTYQQIADELGYSDRGEAHHAVRRAINDIAREPAEAAIHFELERLDAELGRLEQLETAAREVLERHHVTVSAGGQIVHHQGEPLLDDAPVLQAIDRLLKIEDSRRRNGESRRKLLGLDAPSRVSIEAEQLGREIGRLLDAALDDPGEAAGDDTDA